MLVTSSHYTASWHHDNSGCSRSSISATRQHNSVRRRTVPHCKLSESVAIGHCGAPGPRQRRRRRRRVLLLVADKHTARRPLYACDWWTNNLSSIIAGRQMSHASWSGGGQRKTAGWSHWSV